MGASANSLPNPKASLEGVALPNGFGLFGACGGCQLPYDSSTFLSPLRGCAHQAGERFSMQGHDDRRIHSILRFKSVAGDMPAAYNGAGQVAAL